MSTYVADEGQLAPTEPEAAPRGRGLGLALTLISAAQLMVVLDATIVNIALPHIQTDLGFTQANLSWVVTIYTLAFGGLLLLGGRLGDLFGRRRMFMAGVVLFAAASLLGGIAQNEQTMLIARIIQGIGGALASPNALALITTTFPAGAPRNRAMGVYAAMSGAGAAIGLILGGALTEIDWRWTFFINVPIGIAVALLAPRVLPESEPGRGGLDLPGAVTSAAGLSALVYGLTHAAQTSWSNGTTVEALSLGVALLAAFAVIEARSTHPLLPLRILQSRTRGTSFGVMLIVGAGMFAMFYFLSLYIQQVLGYSPMKAGLAFLPFSVGIVVAAQIASSIMTRVQARWISGPGAVLAAVGMWGFSHLTVGSSYAGGLLPWILLLSFGLGLVFVPMTLTAVHGVAVADSSVASAVLNTMQQIGGAIGLATLSTVFATNAKDKAAELGAAAQASAQNSGVAPAQDQLAALTRSITLQAQTFGSTRAFLVGSALILLGAILTMVFLRVRPAELSTDGAAPVHVG